ncbi:unnamed protein product [Acanthoscelides obtectus]|uniref:Large ribosomal subunit protein mL44 n=1 Tax=Acanthoscelides obtectus TaxID=200917 RepID=A0A9P0NWG7_ACAOB|nr:unnamed protein product [Acanthoscelides obtectus]CAK1663808.1 39S ribosomal protein L44, mitochondrial [Acanthoscelides obtectus]
MKETRQIHRWVAPTLKVLKHRRDSLGPEPQKPRSSFIEWNYEAELFAFGKRLGDEFDKKLLHQALTSREYANLKEFQAQEKGIELTDNVHNDELIQEGEEIILKTIKEEYKKDYPEDLVNAVCNYLTSEDMLGSLGKGIGLKDIVLTNEFPVETKTLSNAFKAIVATVQRSSNSASAQKFVQDFVLAQMNGKDVYEIWNPAEPYKYLTELLNEKGITSIEPRLCNESAKNTILACFQVGLYSDKKLLGIGWGENVDIAKETAALDAIQRIHKNQPKTQ